MRAIGLFAVTVMVCAGAPLIAQPVIGPAAMTGGGEVTLRRDGPMLRVSVRGPRAGLASLCVGDDSRVRILHASAAVGEAVYEREGDRWARKSAFDFKLRDSRTGPAPEADRNQYLAAMGWVANADRTGEAVREFTIRIAEGIRFIGVTFLATSDPMAMAYWPAQLDDDCRAVKVAQGYLPDTAQFRPATWHRIE